MFAIRLFAILLPLVSFLVPLSSFAAINASQTMVIQTGAAERARINTNGIETTRVSATYISTTLVQASGTPTANNHLTTKAYVDAAVAAAGGGRPKYMGTTPSSYTGSLGVGGTLSGIWRGNALCHAAYAGSRMMTDKDLFRVDTTTTPLEIEGWIHCEELYKLATTWACTTAVTVDMGSNPNCGDPVVSGIYWANTSSGGSALTLTSGGIVDKGTCNVARRIHCVKD